MSAAVSNATATTSAVPVAKPYRYSAEIAQMCFVYGQLNEVDEAVAQSIEDIVKTQLNEIVSSLDSVLSRSAE